MHDLPELITSIFKQLRNKHQYVAQSLSCVQLFATLRTVACQPPLSMGFPRQEYWSELPFPFQGVLSNPGVEFVSPAQAGRFFTPVCLVAQSFLTLCNPMGCSTPGPYVHGDSPGKNTGVSCHFPFGGFFPTQGLNSCLLHRQADSLPLCAQSLSHFRLSATPWAAALQAPMSVGILQARILEWLAISFSWGSSQPKDQTQVSHIAGIFFTD